MHYDCVCQVQASGAADSADTASAGNCPVCLEEARPRGRASSRHTGQLPAEAVSAESAAPEAWTWQTQS